MLTDQFSYVRHMTRFKFDSDYIPDEYELNDTEHSLTKAYHGLRYLASCPGTDSDFRIKLDQAMMALAALAKPFDTFKKECLK